ncbi:MAG: hypothetical protein ACR2QO_11580 [Acidimicrobiales bacterium]
MRDVAPNRARAIATTAYLFLYPLVIYYRDMYRQAIDISSPTFSGGFGTWRHAMVRERRRGGGGRPLGPTLRSTIWLDLRSEPWWCSIGETPSDVEFSARWSDLWGFLLGPEGAAPETAHGSPVLVSAPKLVRDVPSEIAGIVRGESAFVALTTETRWRDPFALPGVEPIRPEIGLEPMSAIYRRPVARPAPSVGWYPWHDAVETTDEFWACANFALSLIEPAGQDAVVYERLAEIGVVGGRPWDASMFSDEAAAATQDGVDEAISQLLEAAGDPSVRSSPGFRREDMDRDYFGRAARALDRYSPIEEP